MRVITAVLVLACVLPFAASAGAQSFVPAPPVVNRVVAACPGLGAADQRPCSGAPSTVYWDPAWPDPAAWQHELGHLFDYQVLTDADRAAFQRIIHLAGPWRPGTGAAGPAEFFAVAYSQCALHSSVRRASTLGYGYRTTPKRHQAVCDLIRNAGQSRGTA